MNYSNFEKELKCLQIHRFLNDFYKDPTIKTQYKQYFEKIEEKLELVRDGEEIPFSFLRALLLNCYNKVRSEYEELINGRISERGFNR
ncbi:UNVERIFIED_CONTAM: hypothetical protein ABIC26_004754 [Paenibacillus sp. PvR008]